MQSSRDTNQSPARTGERARHLPHAPDATEVNVFDGARQFVHRWDFFRTRPAPSALGLLRISARTSTAGNINQTGAAASAASTMVLPWQDGFWDAIEPGVRDLVRLFAVDLDLVTYTSCAGHHYPEAGAADERRLGILPRSTQELDQVRSLLQRTLELYGETPFAVSISASLQGGQLNDRGALLEVLDVCFRRRPGMPWAAYFAEVGAASAAFECLARVTWAKEKT